MGVGRGETYMLGGVEEKSGNPPSPLYERGNSEALFKAGASTMQCGVISIGRFAREIEPAHLHQHSLLQARAAVANNINALLTAQNYPSGPASVMTPPAGS